MFDDDRIRTLGLLLHAHAGLVAALGHDLEARAGMPLSSYEVLLQLGLEPSRRLRMAELAKVVSLSASGLTRLVDRLEADGLVRRERCPNDRRGAFAVLTETGAARLDAATSIHVEGIDEHLMRRLSPAQLDGLRDALATLVAATPQVPDQGGCGGGMSETRRSTPQTTRA